jgi:elongator complex protein 1
MKMDHNVNQMAFLRNPSDSFDCNCFLTVDDKDKIALHRSQFSDGKIKHIVATETIGKLENSIRGSHFLWIKPTVIVYASSDKEVNICTLSDSLDAVTSTRKIALNNTIVSIDHLDENHALVQDELGAFITVNVQDSVVEKMLKLPEFCEQVTATNIDGKNYVVALKNKQSLYINDEKVQSDVTSYFISHKFLAFTTIASLKFMDLTTTERILYERRLERGSKLITIVPNDSKTILQLPRGNLEAIHPRVLSLYIIGGLLDELEFAQAFDILRKQRINLNLLVDHNPTNFIENVQRFVNEIDNYNWLNLFLTDLQNQNVCETIYPEIYRSIVNEGACYKIDDKVNTICDKMLAVLQR